MQICHPQAKTCSTSPLYSESCNSFCLMYRWKMEKITKTRLGFQCQTLASYLYLTKSFGFMFTPRPAVLTIERFWLETIVTRTIVTCAIGWVEN